VLFALANAVASLWHLLAFAIGLSLLFHHVRALYRQESYDRQWAGPLRMAELHLWQSGIAIIGVGIAQFGLERYASNPKLWAKVAVVLVWAASIRILRTRAAAWLRSDQRSRLVAVSSISAACWLYGAFLGCARGLAFGVAPFAALAAGFAATLVVSVVVGFALERRFQANSR
jgi:hypothetical protein